VFCTIGGTESVEFTRSGFGLAPRTLFHDVGKLVGLCEHESCPTVLCKTCFTLSQNGMPKTESRASLR
jgi:hypothetical protein